MSIYGIGTDIVQINRISKIWQEHEYNFAKRILTKDEYIELKTVVRPVNFLAKRFAAKEAVAKALGTGFRGDVFLSQIGVQNDANGKPSVIFYAKTKQYVQDLGENLGMGKGIIVHLSITDEIEMVVAFAVVEV